MPALVVFVVSSIAIAYVSRASLRKPRSHGFYRFFAWECILALALLNLPVWFHDPLSAHQLVSWPLLLAAAFLLVHGLLLLRNLGKPSRARAEDAPLLSLEKTTTLVTRGAYRYIRHPLYSSLLFLAWGVFFKDLSWLGATLALVSSLFLVLTAKAEEAEDVRFFGQAYRAYLTSSPL